jgi:HEAT repeat protein
MRGPSRLLGLPTLATLAALAGALTTPACRRRAAPPPPPPAPPLLGTIAIEDRSPPSDERLDAVAIEAELRRVLLASGLFAAGGADAGAAPTARARVAFAAECVEEGAKGEARAQVLLRIDTRPSEAPGALAFDLQGQGVEPYPVVVKKARGAEAPAPPARPSLSALVVRISRDLVESVAARRRLQDGAPSAVHAALVADGGELREEAIRIVGERGLRDEVPTLLKLLGSDDESVRDAALGALIAMRERRAVRELTESRSLRDRREMRKIIEAISILGGQEADEYLSFVAATHDDDEIRTEAAAARARLQRREAEAGR